MSTKSIANSCVVLLKAILLAVIAANSYSCPTWSLKLPDSTSLGTHDDTMDLIKIHESTRPIECSGVKQVDLAPQSKIVAIHFGDDREKSSNQASVIALNINHNAFSDSKKQPGKQSQEFDLANEQQVSTTSRPAGFESGETSSNNNNTSCEQCKPTTEIENISSSSPATTTTTTTTTTSTTTSPSSSSGSTESSPTTTTTSSTTTEPNSVVDSPVGTKTIRQGDAVFCGEANPNGKSNKRLMLDRIVGGRKTEPGEFPFQVRLNIRSRRGSGICGGVILDKYHILTAAHCMTACASQYLTTATIENTGVHATIGDHSIKSNDGEVEIDVDKIIPHEKYDACNFYANDHDIALIRTSSPIEYRFTTDGYGSINRPCMPPGGTETSYREGESVIVSGWGVTRENSGSLSNILRYVQVPIVNTTKCQETYGSRVTKDHVCAGYQSGGRDSCQGDSGGPLVRVVDNRYELVGIVSFGYGCGQPGAPGVYTRVASYIDWIKANLS